VCTPVTSISLLVLLRSEAEKEKVRRTPPRKMESNMKIKIELEGEVFEALLTGEFAPKTVEKIVAALPIESDVMVWGDEVYFDVPVEMDEENAKETVSKGDLGYWPAGNTLCIFYGKTPISESDEEIRPASAVNIVGRIAEPDRLKRLDPKGGERIRISEWQ
jgi:hypothetical protein